MVTRPNIKLQPNVDNDVYALLNAQAGYPAVTVGTVLRIQNKGGSDVYIHEAAASIEKDGGSTLPSYWQATTAGYIHLTEVLYRQLTSMN
ncbi:hypothetical protein [Pseudoalteromonas phage XCL1123]|nr:hypothetical protein [Pseudoalteromonas phage XCL1123]